ncbi:hypothetical protein ACOMCU_08475 [Lysinibacillus sp. UGB7]|uniref:hypothetical protein n=1 Tax=Lysinibacillus sp. UGB7 TaxID=3411039 RepID=UPI003B75F16B
MTKNTYYEMEVILLSNYCEIVVDILKKHKNLSIIKIAVFSFITKKNKFFKTNIYNLSNKKEIVLKCLSLLNGVFDDFCNDLKYIIAAIDLLVKNHRIEIIGQELFYNKNIEISLLDSENFIDLAIRESSLYSDEQFLKEVVSSV